MKSKSKTRSVAKRRSGEVSRDASAAVGTLRFDRGRTAGRTERQTLDPAAQLRTLRKENEQLKERLGQIEQQLANQTQAVLALETQARTDALTGLLNRRAFDEEMVRRIAAWRRRAIPFALIWMDVDHFKSINDRCGHAAGDELLRGVSEVLSTSFRDMDLVARVGGEEFAALLPVTSAEEVVVPADRLRRRISGRPFDVAGRRLTVTLSIGVTAVRPDDDIASMIHRADQALYSAKASGRNVVASAELGRIEPTSTVR
jgi:diguanylate cyclase